MIIGISTSNLAIVKAIAAVDRLFDEEERLTHETRLQSLADLESKIVYTLATHQHRFIQYLDINK